MRTNCNDSDPEINNNAWVGGKGPMEGFENGEMCGYVYGKTERDPRTHSAYNYVSTSGRKFLVQLNWDPELNRCASKA